MLLADVYLSLCALTQKTGATLQYYTAVELKGMQFLPKKVPDSFFSITETNGSSKRFIVLVFNPYQFEKEMIKRIDTYCAYYKKGVWQKHNPHPFPQIICICGENKSKSFVKMIVQKRLLKTPGITFLLTTWQEIQTQGVNKKVLQKVTI